MLASGISNSIKKLYRVNRQKRNKETIFAEANAGKCCDDFLFRFGYYDVAILKKMIYELKLIK